MAGTIVADTIQDGAGNSTAMDNAIYGSAKAWVNFNGVTTTTIYGSYNTSSVTRNSAGNYTIAFTNALTDANYAVALTLSASGAGSNLTPTIASAGLTSAPTLKSTTQLQIITAQGADSANISAIILR